MAAFDDWRGDEARQAGGERSCGRRIRWRICGRSGTFGSAFAPAASFAGLPGVAGSGWRTRARGKSLDEGGETCAALLES
jgi:hypothetical protein